MEGARSGAGTEEKNLGNMEDGGEGAFPKGATPRRDPTSDHKERRI